MTQGSLLLETTDSSLRILLLVELYTAIYLRGDLFDTTKGGSPPQGIPVDLAKSHVIQWFQSPLMSRIDRDRQVIYRCPIALALASKLQIPPQKLVRQMADSVLSNTKYSDKIWIAPSVLGLTQSSQSHVQLINVQLKATESGWLEFSLDDRAIQVWIFNACHQSLSVLPPVNVNLAQQASLELWQCWHCYKRCISLLAQAQQTHVDLLQYLDHQLEADRFIEFDRSTRPLILSLLSFLDELEELVIAPQADSYLRIGSQISQVFQGLGRCHTSQQIIRHYPIELGLIILIQRLLFSILYQGLGQGILNKL